MSKEQLKKAKVLADMIRKETRLPHNFPYELIDWLIEQAERAQELEEFNRILSSDKSMFIEELVREQQQNKRYREVIEYVMTAKSTHYSSLENALEDIKYVINEVLERDSE